MLAADVGKDDHEAQQVQDELVVAKHVGKLVARRLAPGHADAALLLMLGFDHVDEVLGREAALVVELDLDAHVVEALEVHQLRLALPDLLPLTL